MNFVYDCYRTEHLRITYGHTLIPINGQDVWELAPGIDIKALVFPTKKKGNLKFKRSLKPGKTTTKHFGKVSKCGAKIHCETVGVGP
mgnify:CR=1 FL=1